jgi:hypothetical protein
VWRARHLYRLVPNRKMLITRVLLNQFCSSFFCFTRLEMLIHFRKIIRFRVGLVIEQFRQLCKKAGSQRICRKEIVRYFFNHQMSIRIFLAILIELLAGFQNMLFVSVVTEVFWWMSSNNGYRYTYYFLCRARLKSLVLCCRHLNWYKFDCVWKRVEGKTF